MALGQFYKRQTLKTHSFGANNKLCDVRLIQRPAYSLIHQFQIRVSEMGITPRDTPLRSFPKLNQVVLVHELNCFEGVSCSTRPVAALCPQIDLLEPD